MGSTLESLLNQDGHGLLGSSIEGEYRVGIRVNPLRFRASKQHMVQILHYQRMRSRCFIVKESCRKAIVNSNIHI